MEKRIRGRHWLQHRYILTKHLGRELLPTEHVHHKDGHKCNNVLSNLEIVNKSDHHAMHLTKEKAKEMSILGHAKRWGYTDESAI
jgi:hypothetical protein